MSDWFENDPLFRRELEVGYHWARKVVDRLVEAGLDAQLTEMEWRSDIDDRHRFADERDIVVKTTSGEVLLESKSRRLTFTDDPATYPWETALVDTVSGWDRKNQKPTAVVLVSQVTAAMLVVSVRRTRDRWTVKTTRDRIRNIEDHWYEVPRTVLMPMSTLVEWLKSR